MYRLKIAGVRESSIRKILKNFKNYDEIFKLDRNILSRYIGIEDCNRVYQSLNIDLEKEIEKLKKMGISLLSIEDENYPVELKNISQPPLFLYYRGNIDLLKSKKIAVVGTRKPTTYGKVSCEKFVKELVENKITTVSGLALGIDSVCHKITLQNGGNTIAVVGSGLDVVYPKENISLWKEIEKKGLVISEYSLGTQPKPYNFPLRNRIIVGISRGVLVVESREKGGSLITAEIALDENRDVYAIPGDIFSPCSQGTNKLIEKSYGKLVTNAYEILEEYGWINCSFNASKKLNLTDYELKIYNVLRIEKNLDEIILETSMKPGEILSILMELEVKNIICSLPGGKYRRKI